MNAYSQVDELSSKSKKLVNLYFGGKDPVGLEPVRPKQGIPDQETLEQRSQL